MSGSVKVDRYQDKITWMFADDQERRIYLSTRPPLYRHIVSRSGGFIGPILVVIIKDWQSLSTLSGLWAFVLIAYALAVSVYVLLYTSKRIKGISIELQPKRIYLDECGDAGFLMKWRNIFCLIPRRVQSAIWASDSLLVTQRGWIGTHTYALSYQILNSEETMGLVELWFEKHGITIEGVRPIPGAYVRPQLEARGH
ncbi:MAG TPA: hypothetical protein VNI20_00815 [Fimbriimonadaceae bacterium]|nr:hypothetical protein [Fimbriimonadaceae bacterium]